jgi:hypothetical protein
VIADAEQPAADVAEELCEILEDVNAGLRVLAELLRPAGARAARAAPAARHGR